MLETAHEAFISMDATGRILECNRAAELTFGWTREEVLHRDLAAFLVPERHRQAHRAGLQRFLDSGEARLLGRRVELTGLHRDGREFPIEMTVSHAQLDGDDPRAMVFHAFLHDISERKMAEQVLKALGSVTRAMTRAGTPSQALSALLRTLGTDMGWAVGSYWGLGEDGSLELTVGWTAPGVDGRGFESVGRGLRLAPGEGMPGGVLATGEPAWLEDIAATTSPRAQAARETGLRTAIGVPVVCEGDAVGVIEFFTTERREPDRIVTAALSMVGTHAGELLTILEHRHRLLKTLEAQALTDGLTGLPNRRAWQDALDRELARAAREGHPVSVAVVDLDDFKSYNDRHGHQAGDALLTRAAVAWRGELRAGDLLARYGGEEFAAVIPGRGLKASLTVIERLRQATPAERTCSAGLACWDGSETPTELFGRADAAMYAAKQAGRDRTITAA